MKKFRFIALVGVFCAFLTGASFAETTSTAYLVTTSSSINDSIVHIINSSSEAQSFTGTLYNGDGTQLGASKVALHSGTVASQGRLTLSASSLENLFNVPAWTGPAMLEVFGQDSLEVMIKLKSPSGLISNTNCVTKNAVRNIEGFDKSEDSYIRFINTSNSTITNITGSLYDNNGNQIGNPNQVLLSSLGPKEQVWLNRYAVWEKMGYVFWNGEASLVLDQEYPNLKMLMLNFVNSETFFNFSCFDTSSNDEPTLPTAFTKEWLSGRTLYLVLFAGDGTDPEGNPIYNVPTVEKWKFGANGYVTSTGLLNENDNYFTYEVTAVGSLKLNNSDGHYVVACSNEEFIETNYIYNGSFEIDGVELFFFDESEAMSYANSLTGDISPTCN